MERTAREYESRLWQLLGKEKLTDLSQFHRAGCNEVPLFSRERDLKFLPRDRGISNEIVLGFALKFLNSVIACERHPDGYFAAVTFWSEPPEPFVPGIFVSCGAIESFKDSLPLDPVASALGQQVKSILSDMAMPEKFDIREDRSTDADAIRVLVSPRKLPYRGFVTLASLTTASACR